MGWGQQLSWLRAPLPPEVDIQPHPRCSGAARASGATSTLVQASCRTGTGRGQHAEAAQRIWQVLPSWEERDSTSSASAGKCPSARISGCLVPRAQAAPPLLPYARLLQQLCATAAALASTAGRELPLPCSCLPRPHPGLVGAGRSGCPGLPCAQQSCVACRHLLPPAGRLEPGQARACTHCPAPTAASSSRGSPALQGTPWGWAQPWLEEDACSRAEVDATRCCRAAGGRESCLHHG